MDFFAKGHLFDGEITLFPGTKFLNGGEAWPGLVD